MDTASGETSSGRLHEGAFLWSRIGLNTKQLDSSEPAMQMMPVVVSDGAAWECRTLSLLFYADMIGLALATFALEVKMAIILCGDQEGGLEGSQTCYYSILALSLYFDT